MTASKPRAKARAEATKTVTDAWDDCVQGRPETNDPEFWAKYAAHDEALADAYRALNRLTDDRALSMALQDAEEFRRERAKYYRRHVQAGAR